MTPDVCVTGAAGFIAAHIVAQLLADGHHVRGTVRTLTGSEDIARLRALPGAGERLELVEADLLASGSFDAAVSGCRTVFHVASPFVLDVKNPLRDLVDPAVQGTRHVLEACTRTGTVTRVVLTSSMAAMTDEPGSDRVLTEADWNTKSSLTRNPYYLSKTLAEREAWGIAGTGPPWTLVSINPFVVIGPSIGPRINVSNRIFVQLKTGVFPGILNMTWAFVDVRDVADAHIRAMNTPAASGRYLCANTNVRMRELVQWLAREGYGNRLPRLPLDSAVGDIVVKLASYLQPPGVGQYLRTHVGRVPRFDNSRIQRELGVTFRPIEDTLQDTMADLERWGHIAHR